MKRKKQKQKCLLSKGSNKRTKATQSDEATLKTQINLQMEIRSTKQPNPAYSRAMSGSKNSDDFHLITSSAEKNDITTLTPKIIMHCLKVVPVDAAFVIDPTNPEIYNLDHINKIEVTKNKMNAQIHAKNSAVIIKLAKDIYGKWYIVHIKADLQRLLYNHSGRIPDSKEHLFQSLHLLNKLMNKYSDANSQNLCVPGLRPDSKSYFSGIEIATQIKDATGDIFWSHQHAKHNRVRSNKICFKDQTISFKGAEFSLTIYRKDVQLSDKYHFKIPNSDRNILRSECSLAKNVLLKEFGGEKGQRLVSFSFESLYPLLNKAYQGLSGVFYSGENPPQLTEIEGFFFELLKESSDVQKPLSHYLDLYARNTNLTPRRRNKIEKSVLTAWSCHRKIPLRKLFPASFADAHQLNPLREESGKLRSVEPEEIILNYPPEIAEAYSCVRFRKFKNSMGPKYLN